MKKVKLNKLPTPTFSHLGVNHTEREPFDETLPSVTYRIDGSSEQPEYIDITEKGKTEVAINAGENSRISAIEYITSENALLLTDLTADAGACLRLIQVFDNAGTAVSRVSAHISDGASLELVQLYIGGKDIVSEAAAELDGRNSRFSTDIGYCLDGEDKLDIDLVIGHNGKKSISRADVKGVMRGSSNKVFKGTIDLRRGAGGSKGEEREEVLLLNESVVNKTAPLILCSEEDVEGSHGASIGRIGEEHIYYMQSRGIPMNKIYEMAAQAKIGHMISKIGDPNTERRIRYSLGGHTDE